MANKVRGPNGGRRPGAGRPRGSKGKAVLERETMARLGIEMVEALKVTPLQVMLARMAGDSSITDEMFQAAVAAAPYIHPRLQSSDTTIKSDNTHRVVSDEPMTIEQWTEQYGHANDAVSPPLPEDELDAGTG